MEKSVYTKITVEVSDSKKVAIEFPYTDVGVNDMCQAFRTLMVGMTFTDDTAGEMLASYLEEYYGDKYNVVIING